MARPSAVRRRAARAALLVGLAVATTLLVVVAWQKHSLRERYLELAARFHDPYVGMYVPDVRAPSVHGDSVLIGEPSSGERQVLFVFNTTCPYSRTSLDFWEVAAARLRGDNRVQVYGVSTDSLKLTRAYARDHTLTFPVVSLVEPKAQALYHLRQVPQTLILNEEGQVIFARLGVVDSDAAVDSIVAAARARVDPQLGWGAQAERQRPPVAKSTAPCVGP